MSIISTKIKELRLEKGWSLRDVAQEGNISKSAVHMYELGKRNPKRETLETFADIFNCDIDYLLGKSDVRNATANALGYDSLYEAWLNKKLPEEQPLSEGEEKLVSLFRLLPREAQEAYTLKLEEALKTLGLI